MATQLTPQNVAPGTAVTAATADATGNYVVPGNVPVAIRIINGSASSITVTLDDPTTPNPEGVTVTTPASWPDVVITIPAGASRYILLDRVRRRRFVNPTNGRVNWTYSNATTVTVEVVAV